MLGIGIRYAQVLGKHHIRIQTIRFALEAFGHDPNFRAVTHLAVGLERHRVVRISHTDIAVRCHNGMVLY